jgi:hypothetical protein
MPGYIWMIFSTSLSALISALLTMVFIYIRSARRDVEKQRQDLHNLKETLPLDYVRREDFTRWSIKIDKKMDDLFVLVRNVKRGDDP